MHGNGKKLVAVLGMHRAGTSVAARALEVMGVELGPHLIGPRDDNPKGFWEDVEINAFDVEMLHFLDSDWHFLAPVPAEDVDRLAKSGFLQRATALLQEKAGNAQLFGFKDPRLAKLLPFWKLAFAAGGFKADYIVSIRHPISVCKSLANRDGFEPERSYLLWLGYTLSALAGTQTETRVVVDYDRLVQSPDAEIARMARGLGLRVDKEKLGQFKSEFLDGQLRHNVCTLEDLRQEEGVPPLVYEVYSAVLDVASDKSGEKSLKASLDRWLTEYSRQAASLVFADKLERRIEQLTAVAAQVSYKDEVITAKERLILDKDRIIAEKNRTIAEKNQAFAKQEQDIRMLSVEADTLRATVASMAESLSWKVTRPLRGAKAVFMQLRARRENTHHK